VCPIADVILFIGIEFVVSLYSTCPTLLFFFLSFGYPFTMRLRSSDQAGSKAFPYSPAPSDSMRNTFPAWARFLVLGLLPSLFAPSVLISRLFGGECSGWNLVSPTAESCGFLRRCYYFLQLHTVLCDFGTPVCVAGLPQRCYPL